MTILGNMQNSREFPLEISGWWIHGNSRSGITGGSDGNYISTSFPFA